MVDLCGFWERKNNARFRKLKKKKKKNLLICVKNMQLGKHANGSASRSWVSDCKLDRQLQDIDRHMAGM